MNRKRYMITWLFEGEVGRDNWVMERRGKMSPADIKQLEFDIGFKWNLRGPVTITNTVLIN